MKIYEFRLKFHWSKLLRVQLTISQHWFREWLGADQATSHCLNQWWLVYWLIYASLGLNELMDIMVYMCMLHIIWCTVTVESSWRLLMAWCLSGARASATTMVTPVSARSDHIKCYMTMMCVNYHIRDFWFLRSKWSLCLRCKSCCLWRPQLPMQRYYFWVIWHAKSSAKKCGYLFDV